jgi:hypothetical protein
MKLVFGVGTLMILFATLHGCTSDKEDLPEPEIPGLPANCDTTSAVTYTNFVKNLLDTKCNMPLCHGVDAPPGFMYMDYGSIKLKVESGAFKDRVLLKKDMPEKPNPPLDACTLIKLQQWVNAGAPE